MTYATLHMNGREYVLVPKAEFRRLTAPDARGAAKAKRALACFCAGKLRTVSHEALKRRLREPGRDVAAAVLKTGTSALDG